MWHHLARCNPGVLRNTLASPRALNTFPIATGPVFSRMPFESHLKKLIAKTAIENFEVDGRKMYKHACRMASKALSPSPGTADTSPDGAWRTINAPHPLEDPLRSSVEICVAKTHVKAYLFSCEYPPYGSVPLYILQ